MRAMRKLYAVVMKWSRHRHAQAYLAGLSFIESAFFPVPPDVMLIPMTHAKPEKAWWYAFITAVASALGGVFGYIIGRFFFELIKPWIIYFGYEHAYLLIVEWFKVWGIWVILIGAFSPIPYKLFTIGSGAVGMAVLPFAIASCVGRGVRFFFVAAVTLWGGERVERLLAKYTNPTI